MGKPRVLMVGRTRYRLPLAPGLERKFSALERQMDVHVLATAADGNDGRDDQRFDLVPPHRPRRLDGPLLYVTLPFRVARRLRRFQPDAVVTQSPYEALAVVAARSLTQEQTRLVLEVHGDWRTATRLYGSRFRHVLSPLADRLAALALRRADRVRTLSPFTTELVRERGVEPAATFPAYTDLSAFRNRPPRPLPARPTFLFVGVLERYKFVDGLVEAWRRVAPLVPEATLRIVGDGREAELVEQLVADLPEQTAWDRRVQAHEIATALDGASALVLPSRSEGLPRIVIEAFSRGRPVVAARAGGMPDLVEHGVDGMLVEPENVTALAAALLRTSRDRLLLERLARGARPAADRWLLSADEYADRLHDIVA